MVASEEIEKIVVMVSPGWQDIARDALTKAFCSTDQLVIDCIKEKFGGLRTYFHLKEEDEEGYNPKSPRDVYKNIEDIFEDLERLSWDVCEYCGRKSADTKSWNGFWIRSLCQECGTLESQKSKKCT